MSGSLHFADPVKICPNLANDIAFCAHSIEICQRLAAKFSGDSACVRHAPSGSPPTTAGAEFTSNCTS